MLPFRRRVSCFFIPNWLLAANWEGWFPLRCVKVCYAAAGVSAFRRWGEIKGPHESETHAALVHSLISVTAVASFCCFLSKPDAGSSYVAYSSDEAAVPLCYGQDVGFEICSILLRQSS